MFEEMVFGDKVPSLLLQGSGWSSAKLTEPILGGCHCNINTHLEQMWLKAWNIEQTAATDPRPLRKLLCSINAENSRGQEGSCYSPQLLSRWAQWWLLREGLPHRSNLLPHAKIPTQEKDVSKVRLCCVKKSAHRQCTSMDTGFCSVYSTLILIVCWA